MGSFLTDVKGFTPVIDVLVAEVGLTTAAVYGVAWRYCQMSDGVCRASQETIGTHLGIGRETVSIHLQRLCEHGYLGDTTPEAVGKPHVYRDTGKAKIVALLSAEPAEESDTLQPVGKSDTTCRKIPQLPVGKSDTKRVVREKEDSIGAEKKRSAPRKGRKEVHPLDDLYRQHMGILPNAAQSVLIQETVKDPVLFAACLKAWRLRGYKPTNAVGVVDWYKAGGPPKYDGNGKGKRNDRPVEPDLRDSQRYIDAARELCEETGGTFTQL